MKAEVQEPTAPVTYKYVQIPAAGIQLEGELSIPSMANGVVLFVHGSGSSRHSPRNQFVARVIRDAGIATLLFDLLTKDEVVEDKVTRQLRFDIPLLASRLVAVTHWLKLQPEAGSLDIGYFGSSTGVAAALVAAAELGSMVDAIVSRGGRPDLAADKLSSVSASTLLIVGEYDDAVIELNKMAFASMNCLKEVKIVPGATHLFEEPGALEEVARLTASWFRGFLEYRPT